MSRSRMVTAASWVATAMASSTSSMVGPGLSLLGYSKLFRARRILPNERKTRIAVPNCAMTVSRDLDERALRYFTVESVAARSPPFRRADRHVNLPVKTGLCTLRGIVEYVTIGRPDDQDVYVSRRAALLPA
jgi:hypothetical protein